MDCSTPDSSAHGDSPGMNSGVGCHTLLQGSSQLRNWTQVFCIAGGFFTIWPPGKPKDGCESWIIKKAEWWRTDAFELWCWRKLLRVSWTTRSSNQSILKKVDPECSLEGLMLKLKAPILWPPDVKTWLIRKNPVSGRDWRQEEMGTTEDEIVGWHHWPNGHEFEQAPGDGEGQGSLMCCSHWGHSQTRLSNWTTTKPPNLRAQMY